MDVKRVYTFGNGKAEGKADMRNLLGGKGANLAEMNLIGVPVPPGFTITTDVCNEYFDKGRDEVVKLLKRDVEQAVKHIETLMSSKSRRCFQSAVAVCTLRRTSLNARNDGYYLESGTE